MVFTLHAYNSNIACLLSSITASGNPPVKWQCGQVGVVRLPIAYPAIECCVFKLLIFYGLSNYLINFKMALGRKNVPHPCFK